MDNNCLISIIIPVYKVEKYLRQCLDSVVNQTYRKLEIILVDDGSPDSCGMICDEYAQKDTRFKVLHKENGGLSDARNAGLDIFQGDYLMFIDSDDWVDPDFCEKALSYALKYNVSCVAFGVKNIVDGKCAFYTTTDIVKKMSSEEILKHALMEAFPLEFVWNKIFSRNIIKQIRFPKGYLFEDMAFTYQLLHRAKDVLIIPDCIYNYRCSRPGQITETSLSPKAITDRYVLQKNRIPFLIANYPNMRASVITKLAIEAILGLSFVKDFQVRKDMEKFLDDNKEIILESNPNNLSFKIYFKGGLARLLYLKLHPFVLNNPLKRIKLLARFSNKKNA